MSLYKRTEEDRDDGVFWGYLRINGKTHRKCLNTKSRDEAEARLFSLKQEILTDPKFAVLDDKTSFKTYADKLLIKQKDYPTPPSGVATWMDTEKLLNRKQGLLEFFGNKDISSITKQGIEDFIQQLPLNGRKLTTNSIRKHLNVLRMVIGMSDHKVDIPKVKGEKSSPRGYFTLEEYRTIRDKSKELDGWHIYKDYNGTTYTIDLDLHDFIIFMVGSALRPTVGEVFSLKHKDIKERTMKKVPYLEFPLVRKNRKMMVQTIKTSAYAYRDICKRHKDYAQDDYIFLPDYTNRRTASRRMGRHFNVLLKELKMEYGSLGEQRTPYSLRHTSLLFNLSQPNPDLLDICRRADTSMKMIEDFYYPIVAQEEKLEKFLRV